ETRAKSVPNSASAIILGSAIAQVILVAKKGRPDDARLDALYDRLYSKDGEPRHVDGQARHQLQQILYVEDACPSTIASIEQLNIADPDGYEDIINEIKGDIQFLRTMMNDKEFMRSLDYLKRGM